MDYDERTKYSYAVNLVNKSWRRLCKKSVPEIIEYALKHRRRMSAERLKRSWHRGPGGIQPGQRLYTYSSAYDAIAEIMRRCRSKSVSTEGSMSPLSSASTYRSTDSYRKFYSIQKSRSKSVGESPTVARNRVAAAALKAEAYAAQQQAADREAERLLRERAAEAERQREYHATVLRQNAERLAAEENRRRFGTRQGLPSASHVLKKPRYK